MDKTNTVPDSCIVCRITGETDNKQVNTQESVGERARRRRIQQKTQKDEPVFAAGEFRENFSEEVTLELRPAWSDSVGHAKARVTPGAPGG